jgi:hypothetical protein
MSADNHRPLREGQGDSYVLALQPIELTERERDAAELIAEVHWQWRSVCQGTSLAQMIYTPSGPTKAIPMIGHIDVGPPVSFTVRIRPGQTIDDFVKAAPLIAPALGAAALQVTPLVPQWVRVVLLPRPLAA